MKAWIRHLLWLAPTVLGAQQGSAPDTVRLAPVVVTATRLPASADAVPAAVTVLTGPELEARGITTVADALRDVPGAAIVQTGSFGGQTSLFLRGGDSKYVKVLVDGVPVNQPGGSYDFANLTTDNVDRIEVLRGPASVLYGSDAVTGVVQIFTRRGNGPQNAEMSVRGGTYGTLDWQADVAGDRGPVAYSFGLSQFTSDGTYAFNSQDRNTVASGLLRLAPDARTDGTLTVRYDDNAYHFPTNGAGVPTDHNQYTYGNGPTVGLDLSRRFTPRVEGRLLLAANWADGGSDNQPDSSADSTLYHSLDQFRRTSADLRANVRAGAHTVVTVGAAAELEHDRSSNVCRTSFGDCTTPPVDTSRWNEGFYTQVVSDVGGRWSLVGGARLEDNQRFGTFATGRGGVVLRLFQGTRVRATAGNSFREPTFYENFTTGYSVGNPDLRPEHSRAWEVGLEQCVGTSVVLSATWFDQRFTDLIDYNPAPATFGAPNYENIAGATARGLEVVAQLAPARAVSLSGSYAYLHTQVTSIGFDSTAGAEFVLGRPLIRRPAHAARIDAAYRFARRGSVSVAATYVGSRDDQDFSTYPALPVVLPAYTRVDLAAEGDIIAPQGTSPGLAATIRIQNVTNAAYEEVQGFPAPRRTVLVGARVRFSY